MQTSVITPPALPLLLNLFKNQLNRHQILSWLRLLFRMPFTFHYYHLQTGMSLQSHRKLHCTTLIFVKNDFVASKKFKFCSDEESAPNAYVTYHPHPSVDRICTPVVPCSTRPVWNHHSSLLLPISLLISCCPGLEFQVWSETNVANHDSG